MRLEDKDPAYLWDMQQAASEVITILKGHDLQLFLSDRVVVLAVERSIEIIGESARRLSFAFQQAHPEIPWREIIGQRNIIAHEYGQIDHEILFKTTRKDIPVLVKQLGEILDQFETENLS